MQVGTIVYDARIDTDELKRDAKRTESIIEDTSDTAEDGADRSSRSWSSFARTLGTVVATAGAVAAAALFKAGQASWDQVSAVEQATVGLRAYETNADKVNSVLKDLIGYARSDLGVLFKRQDLFNSAQQLKIMGDNTDDLVDHVKILSRSVGLGLSNWDDLNQIVGRVGSTGRLTGDDFDNLTKAGYKLDPALRNTDITFNQLFDSLNKGIPVDAFAGQAKTIEGIGIRFETAFIGIGNALLGVDSLTSKFNPGSLGEKIIQGIEKVGEFLKSSEVTGLIAGIGSSIVTAFTIARDAIKSFLTGFQPAIDYIRGNQQLWEVLTLSLKIIGALILGLIITVGILLVGAFVVLTAAIEVTIWIITAIMEAVIAFGQGIANVINTVFAFGAAVASTMAAAWGHITNTFGRIGGFFQGVWNSIVGMFTNVGTAVGNAIGNTFKSVINSVLRGAVNLINGFINAINAAVDTINKIPGVKINRVGTLPIPQLAAGGIVSSPTLAMIGEGRESEAVIPLSKLDAMLNSDRNTGTSGGDIKIELNMSGIMTRSKSDMRVVAGDLIESINEQLRARQLPEIGDGNLRKGIA